MVSLTRANSTDSGAIRGSELTCCAASLTASPGAARTLSSLSTSSLSTSSLSTRHGPDAQRRRSWRVDSSCRSLPGRAGLRAGQPVDHLGGALLAELPEGMAQQRVPVPADVGQLYNWSRTPYGLVVTLWTTGQAGGYSDQCGMSSVELLRPDGRLVQIGPVIDGAIVVQRHVGSDCGRRATFSRRLHWSRYPVGSA
jgi:hypothetical protein